MTDATIEDMLEADGPPSTGETLDEMAQRERVANLPPMACPHCTQELDVARLQDVVEKLMAIEAARGAGELAFLSGKSFDDDLCGDKCDSYGHTDECTAWNEGYQAQWAQQHMTEFAGLQTAFGDVRRAAEVVADRNLPTLASIRELRAALARAKEYENGR